MVNIFSLHDLDLHLYVPTTTTKYTIKVPGQEKTYKIGTVGPFFSVEYKFCELPNQKKFFFLNCTPRKIIYVGKENVIQQTHVQLFCSWSSHCLYGVFYYLNKRKEFLKY